jgi:MFS family permease
VPPRLSGRRLGLLRSAPDFRLLFLATLASSIGTWLAFVALVIDVFDRTESAAWVSALLVVEFLPLVIIGLVAGPLLDRLPRRRVLIGADIARATVFCAMPFAGNELHIVLLALVAGVATSFFRPAVYAGLPNVVVDDELPRANGLLQSAENVTLAAGPLLGGLLVAWIGPDPAYWLNAASFLISALLILRIRRTLEEGGPAGEGHWRELVEGLGLVKRSRPLLTVLVVWSIFMLASALVSVAEVILAKQVFDAGDAGYGLMLSAMGLGLVLGGLWASEWVGERGVRAPYVGGIAAMAVGIGAAAAAPSVWVASALLMIAGAGNGVSLVCNAVCIQRGLPDQARGRAFTLAMSTSYAALGLGMVCAGPLTDAIGAREVWGIAAGLLAVACLASLLLTRGAAVDARTAREQAVAS